MIYLVFTFFVLYYDLAEIMINRSTSCVSVGQQWPTSHGCWVSTGDEESSIIKKIPGICQSNWAVLHHQLKDGIPWASPQRDGLHPTGHEIRCRQFQQIQQENFIQSATFFTVWLDTSYFMAVGSWQFITCGEWTLGLVPVVEWVIKCRILGRLIK